MTVKEIIADYLKQNGYDGLYANDYGKGYTCCYCDEGSLLNCGESCETCEPAYKHELIECKKCPCFDECGAFKDEDDKEEFVYCGRRAV
jgi:hypothetical protein